MKEELELQLQNDFPFMKQNRVEKEHNTYRRWGCECGDGWNKLIHDLCQAIDDRYAVAGVPIDIVPQQLKEKFATLRFYYAFENDTSGGIVFDFLGDGRSIRLEPENKHDDDHEKKLHHDIAQIVYAFEEKSASVCEWCGEESTAKIRMDMRRKHTLCDECYHTDLKKWEELQKNKH